MKRTLLCALVASCISSTAIAGEPTEKDAIAMVERAAALMKEKGKAELVKSLGSGNPEYNQQWLYIVVTDLKTGFIIANPHNVKLVGKNLMSVHDPDGKWWRREIIELAATQGKGWVSYLGEGPITRQPEHRKVYFERVEDVVIEAAVTVGA